MDKTLRELVYICDEIHRKIDSIDPASFYINAKEVKNDMSQLESIYKQTQSINLKISNIYNICNNKCKTITHRYTKKKQVNKIPWATLNKKQTNLSISKPLTHEIAVNVKVVDDISEVPNIPLCWVKNINQFAMQINGIMFRGNIGNIYNKTDINTNKPTNQTVICKHGNKCKNILNEKGGGFYHDQLDLLNLQTEGKISTEFFNISKKKYRNFLNTSWLHTDMQYSAKNTSMRHFGSRNTLKYELDIMKLNNSKNTELSFNNFRQQCMHDLLVIMSLNQCNILPEYNDDTESCNSNDNFNDSIYNNISNPYTMLRYD